MCPHLGIDPHPVLGQDADMFAEPVRLDGHIALQQLGDLVQHRYGFLRPIIPQVPRAMEDA